MSTHRKQGYLKPMSPTSPFEKRVVFTALEHRASELLELSPAELAVAPRGASALRRIEFVLGRRAIAAALNQLGRATVEPLPRIGRLPVWPAGVRGSLSHTLAGESIRAVAAVTDKPDISGIGVDIETIRSISDRVLERIAHPAEIEWVRSADSARRAIALFAAREALFKAISPLYRQPMLYRETSLIWSEDEGAFHALTELPRFKRPPLESVVSIRYSGDVVLAGTVVNGRI